MRIIGLAGWSGAGKTTLIAKLIPAILERGLTVSTVKHAHHGFDFDRPGKDSFTHRTAGATEVLVASSARFALLHELRGTDEPPFADLLKKMSQVDLVLVEGFKRDSHPKIEVFRAASGRALMYTDDSHIIAVATDTPLPDATLPQMALDDIPTIVDFILAHAMPIAKMMNQVRQGGR